MSLSSGGATSPSSVEIAGFGRNMSAGDGGGLYRLHGNSDPGSPGALSPTNGSNLTHGGATEDYACYSLTDDPQVILAHRIYLYTSLVFVVVGLIGNTLSVLVFTSKGMRTISSNFYLLMLAISDSFYLVSVFLAKLLTTLRCLHFTDTYADILNQSNALCKILHYLSDLFSDYSSMLILCFTIERVIAVYLPLKFKEICTLQRAQLSSLSLLFAIGVLIAPYHFLMIGLHSLYSVCIVRLEWEVEFTVAYMVEALLFRIVPVFVIAVLNVFIIVRVSEVAQIKRRRKAGVAVNAAGGAEVQNGAARKRANRREDKSMQLTVMLILVSDPPMNSA